MKSFTIESAEYGDKLLGSSTSNGGIIGYRVVPDDKTSSFPFEVRLFKIGELEKGPNSIYGMLTSSGFADDNFATMFTALPPYGHGLKRGEIRKYEKLNVSQAVLTRIETDSTTMRCKAVLANPFDKKTIKTITGQGYLQAWTLPYYYKMI
jgi:hypothetical protein